MLLPLTEKRVSIVSNLFIRSQSALAVQICGMAVAIVLAAMTFLREREAERTAVAERVDRIVMSANARIDVALLALGQQPPFQSGTPKPTLCDFANNIGVKYPFVIALLHHDIGARSIVGSGYSTCATGTVNSQAASLWINPLKSVALQLPPVSQNLHQSIEGIARTTPLPAVTRLEVPELGSVGHLLALLAPRHVPEANMHAGVISAIVEPEALIDDARDAIADSSRTGSITMHPSAATASEAVALPAVSCLLSCNTYSAIRRINLGDQPWVMKLIQPAPPLGERYGGSITLALLGVILSTLWMLHVRHAQSTAWQVAVMVERRERELQALNEILIGDIERRKRTTDELTRSRARLRQLTEHNARIKEEERTRIAREIHDDLGQNMLALRIDLSLIADSDISAATRTRIQHALAQIDQTVTAMRLIINELRPAVLDLGLDAAIEWESRKFSRRSGIACALDLQIDASPLPDELTTAFYRITQESLTNIMRHSKATSTSVRLWIDHEWLFMSISDDGIGMTEDAQPRPGSFGLIGIAERAFALGGAFHLDSAPGKGTQLLIAAPLMRSDAIGGNANQCELGAESQAFKPFNHESGRTYD